MTDKAHLEEFKNSIASALSKRLVTIFMECHRDPSLKTADVVTRLKEEMEGALRKDDDATS